MGDKKFQVVINVFGDKRYWGNYTLKAADRKLAELAKAFELRDDEIWLEQAY